MCRCRASCMDHLNGTHPEGSTWHQNSCTSCTCEAGGKLSCKETVCSVACNDPLPPQPGTCCPVCPITVSSRTSSNSPTCRATSPRVLRMDDRSLSVVLFSAVERKRSDQRTSSGGQRLGHGTDHFDRDIDVALRAVDRSHRSRPIPSSSLAIRRLLLQLPSAVLQMRASVRHAGASKRENRTFVKDCLTNRAKHETRLDRRCLSAGYVFAQRRTRERENEDRTREYLRRNRGRRQRVRTCCSTG